MKTLMLGLFLSGSVFGGITPSVEGTSLKSTGVATGQIPIAQGGGKTAWGVVATAALGDVAGPALATDGSIALFNGNTGKAIKMPPGADANNYFKLDLTQQGSAYLHGDQNQALSYYVHNSSSGTNARSIISFGNDLGINLFSIANTSTGFTAHPFANSAVWSYSGSGKSVLRNTDSSVPIYFVLGTGADPAVEIRGTSGSLRSWGTGTVDYVEMNGSAGQFLTASKSVAGGATAVLKNASNNASAYLEMDLNSNTGTLALGHTSSTYSNAAFGADTAYVISNNANGLIVGTQGGPIKFETNGVGSSYLRGQIKQNGVWNLPLTNYANDGAAGSAGLVAGDLYQTAGAVMVKQ